MMVSSDDDIISVHDDCSLLGMGDTHNSSSEELPCFGCVCVYVCLFVCVCVCVMKILQYSISIIFIVYIGLSQLTPKIASMHFKP